MVRTGYADILDGLAEDYEKTYAEIISEIVGTVTTLSSIFPLNCWPIKIIFHYCFPYSNEKRPIKPCAAEV